METSFSSYTFTYKWKVDLNRNEKQHVNSPKFNSPSGAKPATAWMLTVFDIRDTDSTSNTPPPPVGEQSLSVELKRLTRTVNSGGPQPYIGGRPVHLQGSRLLGGPVQQLFNPQVGGLTVGSSPKKDIDQDVWVEATLKSQTSCFENLTKFNRASSVSQGPIKLCISSKNSDAGGPSAITFKQFLPLSKIQDSQSMTFECEIKVSSEEPPPINFSLSKFMEEARQNDLFTDVTLVADGKEYKAHKVVLASQSQFFETRFSGRWVSPAAEGDKVEMTDVPAVSMEAILSYVYTGKVANIGKIAYQLLPIAEEYGVVGLRKMCEADLIQSLTSKTVINMLIHATDNNAPDLKKACMEFIVSKSNIGAVRQSEGWGKLKEDQTHHDLWVELLENIVEDHCTSCTEPW